MEVKQKLHEMTKSTNPIYILSQPTQTGKTSLLMDWVLRTPNVGGILTPDVNGMRKLFDIDTQHYHNLQIGHQAPGIKIGRFTFDPVVFNLANNIIEQSTTQQYNWIVVDEIGRLEMEQQRGLATAVSAIIKASQTGHFPFKLLLVIRDYLLNDAINYYQLQSAIILDKSFFYTTEIASQKEQTPLIGIVLCGGQSVRMGVDKAFIIYINKAQYAYVADMLKAFCSPIFISCNSKQQPAFLHQYKSIIDNATFGNIGPIAGVLTAFEQYPQSAILVIGCDYPYLQKDDIEALCVARDTEFDAVCYQNNETGFDEPLLAIYEKKCALLLLQYFQNGHHSLRYFLQTIRTKRIYSKENNRIQSVDC